MLSVFTLTYAREVIGRGFFDWLDAEWDEVSWLPIAEISNVNDVLVSQDEDDGERQAKLLKRVEELYGHRVRI